ncbi:AraC family transcriptional regulator [Opitutus sp. ER46]|uniref:helix-turn-helix domain-containing protein n=1 Tax=Opitutus sp. ER46 TaxID=2161864 RepID=UPI000D32817F|nr:AraC family transcriptional regulator [Opitutus sp. ER46]PTX92296.1 AraC family transcriptional regulator [Opitutus sp. ER46]
MTIPDKTSTEAYLRYTKSRSLRASRGKAWQDLKAWIHEPLRTTDALALPAVNEPHLAWTFSGEVEFQEREGNGPWVTHRIRQGSFFLTTGGGPYECRWKALTPEPFLAMMVFVELPLFNRALEEVFGADAPKVRLRDLSAFTDPDLNWMMENVRGELMAPRASALRVQGLAHLIAMHLARHYAEIPRDARGASSSLPGYKLKQVTDWMESHLDEPFDLAQTAAMAGLSKFHFHRLFKSATGMSPGKYHVNARMQEARRRLRETDQSIVAVALDLGFSTPSHFAQVFRRETGLSPSDYRRKR